MAGDGRMADGAFWDEYAWRGDECPSRGELARRTSRNSAHGARWSIHRHRSHVCPCPVQVGPERPSHVWRVLLSLGIMLSTTRQTNTCNSLKNHHSAA